MSEPEGRLPTVHIDVTHDQFLSVMTGNTLRHDGARYRSPKDFRTLEEWRAFCRSLDEQRNKTPC